MIYETATIKRARLLFSVVMLLLAFDLSIEPFEQVAALPYSWFRPVGLWMLVPESLGKLFWSPGPLQGLRFGAIALLTLSVLATRFQRMSRLRRPLALSGVVLAILCNSFVRGLGYINHAHVPLLFLALWLGFMFDEKKLAEPQTTADQTQSANPPSPSAALFVSCAVLFAYFYVGIALYRLCQSGVPAFFGDVMRHYAAMHVLRGSYWGFDSAKYILQSDAVLALVNLGYALTTVAELSSPWVHLHRKATMLWLAVVLFFHLAVFLSMNVFFFHNMILLVMLYAWPLFWEKVPSRSSISLRPPEFESPNGALTRM